MANHYWHRRVVGLGKDHVDIADNTNAADYASGSDIPQEGDEVATLGNFTKKERQSAIIQSAAGTGAPYLKILRGIDSFVLPHPVFLFDNERFEIRIENPQHAGEYVRLEDYLGGLQGSLDAVRTQTLLSVPILFLHLYPCQNSFCCVTSLPYITIFITSSWWVIVGLEMGSEGIRDHGSERTKLIH